MIEFSRFAKIPRLHREVVITEKIDGTNAQVHITLIDGPHDETDRAGSVTTVGDLIIRAGSRKRWITPGDDNFGFASWVRDNAEELARLGPGAHYGEWFGAGIQRKYGLTEKRFALFNTSRWSDPEVRPKCCDVVPVLWRGNGRLLDIAVRETLSMLEDDGSVVASGFMQPEGIVIYHSASGQLYKVTLEDDDQPKSLAA